MTATPQTRIEADLPPEKYHAHPALSASRAKYLLPPHTPADYLYRLQHPDTKASYDFGHLAHRRVLGVGDEYEVVYKVTRDKQRVPADSMDTVSAKAHAAEIREQGKTPVLEGWLQVVEDMAAKIREHKLAHSLLSSGQPEQSMFWTDQYGVERRARLDIMPDPPTGGRRMIVPDYKTARAVAPALFNKKIGDYGYDLQAANYLAGVAATQGQDDAAFVWVVQLSVPPYHVALIEPDADWLRIGRERMDLAARTLAKCQAEDHWPAYPDIYPVGPPAWVDIEHEALMEDEAE